MRLRLYGMYVSTHSPSFLPIYTHLATYLLSKLSIYLFSSLLSPLYAIYPHGYHSLFLMKVSIQAIRPNGTQRRTRFLFAPTPHFTRRAWIQHQRRQKTRSQSWNSTDGVATGTYMRTIDWMNTCMRMWITAYYLFIYLFLLRRFLLLWSRLAYDWLSDSHCVTD